MENKNSSPLEKLKKEKNKINNYIKLLNSINKNLEKNTVKSLKSSRRDLKKAESTLNILNLTDSLKYSLKEELEQYRNRIAKSLTERSRHFTTDLEKILKDYGIKVKGNIPKLMAGIYEIKMDEEDLAVTIYYGQEYEKIAKTDMDAEVVAKKIISVNKSLFDTDKFEEKSFLENLLKAYKRYISLRNIQFGERVPLKDFLGEFAMTMQKNSFYTNPVKKNYKEYSRLQFSADLSKIKTRIIDNNKFILVTATRAYTSKSSNFIWVPQNEKGEGNWYSHLQFKKI